MIPLINLLPWRPLRRRRQLKRWSGVLIGGVLSTVGLIWLWTQPLAMKVRWQQMQTTQLEMQESALKALLAHQQIALKARQQRWARFQAEARRKGSVSRWEGVLNRLASGLPENSWLQSVSWQNKSAIISGVAGDARALEQFEAVLIDLPGAFEVKPGALRDEKHKGLAFTFNLIPKSGEYAE